MVHPHHRAHTGKWGVRAMRGDPVDSYRDHDGTDAAQSSHGEPPMTTTHVSNLDQSTAEALANEFHRCFTDFTARDDLFASDAFFDLLPPLWRFQLRGSGETFCGQLRSIARGPVDVEIVRTLPTSSGFVTEHVETQHTPDGDVVARRVHLCQVRDNRISEVTTYCNGGWDEQLRSRHAADAPMIRP